MNIKLTDRASEWFQSELSLNQGDFLRFHVRYGGSSPIQTGFSLGFTTENPIDIAIKHEVNGIIYFIEEEDLWYFDGHDLLVDVDENLDGPIYEYK
ncbi:HesB/YadR/YfhF family protein [Bacillus sp. FJAT-50079]|uniref:HesB/YadR/YfhF family protein n=1 Tax=Bacillus sp. FJAT-50079 TaxID=2833577 RepID=UPI001BC9F71F|nr:HesB/YadR/YfhF family protein [Bacillus sp. FJAT-50079]MBS4207413.1 HesB/YadR/YfhF family protein [Bacillus sp. FJAT-50079]